MAKGNAIVMYLEQARIHGEPIGVTHSEVLLTKPNGYTVQPHNRVVSKADNKTMGESFLNELIYVLGAEDGEERKLPYDREVLVYTSDEINSDNYRTYINAVNTGICQLPRCCQPWSEQGCIFHSCPCPEEVHQRHPACQAYQGCQRSGFRSLRVWPLREGWSEEVL